jgi:hypothetical protein
VVRKQCAVSCEDGVWEVLFDCEPGPRRVAFTTRAQAMLSATEWTWSERLKGHHVDLSLPAASFRSRRAQQGAALKLSNSIPSRLALFANVGSERPVHSTSIRAPTHLDPAAVGRRAEHRGRAAART